MADGRQLEFACYRSATKTKVHYIYRTRGYIGEWKKKKLTIIAYSSINTHFSRDSINSSGQLGIPYRKFPSKEGRPRGRINDGRRFMPVTRRLCVYLSESHAGATSVSRGIQNKELLRLKKHSYCATER